jgi:hypothetical protein
MKRSRIRISGASCLAFVTASRSLTASAQTHPGWSSINLRSPDRTGTLSSAIRTRVKRSSQTTNTLSSRVVPVDTDNGSRKVRNSPMGRLREPLSFDAYALIKLRNARYCMCPIRDYVLYDVRHIKLVQPEPGEFEKVGNKYRRSKLIVQ